MIKLSEVINYTGSYRGISFKIANWQTEAILDILPAKDNWTYYIYICLGKIPEAADPESFWLTPIIDKSFPKHKRYNYDGHPVLGNIFFHGGCTWYAKRTNEDTDPEDRLIEVGCDFQHYWDEGHTYNKEYVLEELKRTIDEFLQQVPGYKWRCPVVGGYWDASEGQVAEDGQSFISNAGLEWQEKRKQL